MSVRRRFSMVRCKMVACDGNGGNNNDIHTTNTIRLLAAKYHDYTS